MRQLGPLDAQFLNVESPTTVGHVGSLILVDPVPAPNGEWSLETVRAHYETRLQLAPRLRQRLAEVPLRLGRPYWVDDPHFDLEFHLRELALPSPGTPEQLAEQVARIHARPLDRTRPLWEAYVITGLQDGGAALYSKVHHAVIDKVSGAEILQTILDPTPQPRPVEPEAEPYAPRRMPSALDLAGRALTGLASNPAEVLRTLPRTLEYVDALPGAANYPAIRLVGRSARLLARLLGQQPADQEQRLGRVPRTPLNGPITAHRRFAFGEVSLSEVKEVKDHFGMTVNDVVMALTATALRRWLLDHDALPEVPLVAAVPVSVRTQEPGEYGNQVSVMTAELPTHLADPAARLRFTRTAMLDAKRHFQAVPATLLQDLSQAIPTALSGLATRALFRLATLPGPPFNLFVSNIPGPRQPLYVAGASVQGIYPVSVVTDATGALNLSLFSYRGALNFGFVACRERVPDVWNLVGYLQEAMAELLSLARTDTGSRPAPARRSGQASGRSGRRSETERKVAAAGRSVRKSATRKSASSTTETAGAGAEPDTTGTDTGRAGTGRAGTGRAATSRAGTGQGSGTTAGRSTAGEGSATTAGRRTAAGT